MIRHVASNNYEWTKAEGRANLVVGTEVARLAPGNWDSQMLLGSESVTVSHARSLLAAPYLNYCC